MILNKKCLINKYIKKDFFFIILKNYYCRYVILIRLNPENLKLGIERDGLLKLMEMQRKICI